MTKTKYKLYAISTGRTIKLGLSKRIDKTLLAMQEAALDELELIWTYYVGMDRDKARRELVKLRKFCKGFAEGDGFSLDVEAKIRKFKVKTIGIQPGVK